MKNSSLWNQLRVGLLFVFGLLATPSDAAPATIASRTANVDGVQLHYLTAGSGPAVLILIGYIQTWRIWRPFIPFLAEKFSVIAPHLLGIGDSSIPADTNLDMITATNQSHDVVRTMKI